ncbi:MAG: hypothetical protein H0U76_15395 [Ktedonobacteraceae bacterium]|nr:hypothetical protein [Ktedonobacteraceae bacterium]
MKKATMKSSQNQRDNRWWAEGDTPPRAGSQLVYFVDGRAVMLDMCRHFLKARKYIYLANWGMTPGIELVRGEDRHAVSLAARLLWNRSSIREQR